MDMLVVPSMLKRRRRAGVILALGLLMGGWVASAQAYFGFGLLPGIYTPQTYYKYGAVYTRAIVPGPNKRPVYVEYDSTGKEVREIGEAIDRLERVQVMSGDSYRAYLQRLKDSQARYPDGQVLTAKDYRSRSFKTVDGKAVTKPPLDAGTLTVLVRADQQLFDASGKDLVLLQLPIRSSVVPSSSSQSLLLSDVGEIIHQTANAIGFRVGFFGKDGKVSQAPWRDHESEIYGPLPGTMVTMGSHVVGGNTMTDVSGKFSMRYKLPPCPGFYFPFTTPVYLELYYKRFNPRGTSYTPYYMVRQDEDSCNGLGVWSLGAAAVVATMATPLKIPRDFPVDLMVLDGAARFGNVKFGDETAYNAQTGERGHHLQEKYDFDGDGKPDWVVPGKKVTKQVDGQSREVFVTTTLAEAELQGIYLTSHYNAVPASTEDTGPDFTRLIDTAPDFEDRGLLSSISKADLLDTDIYVFRESNGQLVAERRGLMPDELNKNYSGVDQQQGSFRYTIQLRGSVENYYTASLRTGEANFTKLQSAGGFRPEFQKYAANHLKAGEVVRIIAINRPTGYMGSAKVQLQSAVAIGNRLNFDSQQIELAPPNLKVWAERKNKIEQGMTKGEVRKQLIGNEGAGLGSDVSIAIYTDWRDADGSPLPEEMADYGYTGRLAKIVAANQLAPVGANSLSQFKIKPGQQVQVIQLPEKVLAKQHLYLQVAGQPDNRNPDFSSKGNGQGILKYRPSRYVPVQVPIHDEEASELARQAYRVADRANPNLNLKKPEPIYQWRYRSELQFSLYELNMKEVRRVDADKKIDQVYGDAKPVIASSDQFLELYYDLVRSEIGALEQWSQAGEKEIVLAFGEQEVKVAVGKDQTIRFDNLQHLGSLDVDDFLSMRLYTNNDKGNTLLEWAFEYLTVFADDDEDINESGRYYYLSADSPVVDIKAILAGYYMRRESIKKPETVRWGVEGSGSVSPMVDNSGETGIFSTVLTLPPVAGSKARVYANLQGGDAKAYFKEILVVPGEVATITARLDGQLLAGGMGEIEATILIKDRNGNPVVNGLGADLSIEGEGEITDDSQVSAGNNFKIKIGKAQHAGDNNYLVVKVDGVEQRFKYSVGELSVRAPEPLQVRENQVVELKFGVPNVAGSNLKPELLGVKVSKGTLLEGRVDAEGNLVYRWHTGYATGPASVYFSNGGARQQRIEYEVLPTVGSILPKRRAVALVASPDGYVDVPRQAGGVLKVAVPVQQELRLKGKANETVAVRIGNPTDSNRQSILSLRPSDLGRSQFLVDGIKKASAAGFRYQQSNTDNMPVAMNYKGYGMHVSDLARVEEAVAGEGAHLNMVFEGADAGVLMAWRDLLSFEISAGKLVVRHKAPAGQQEDTYPLSLATGQNRLALFIKGRDFTYELGELRGTVSIDPAVVSSGGDLHLLKGRGMGLRALDIGIGSAPALVTVNGQAADTTVVLDAQGEGTLDIRMAGTAQAGHRSVPIAINGEAVTVTSYSAEAATRLLGAVPMDQGFTTDEVQDVLGRDTRDPGAFNAQRRLALQIMESATEEADKAQALLRLLEAMPEGHNLRGTTERISRYIAASPAPFQRVLTQEVYAAIEEYPAASMDAYYKRILALVVLSEVIQDRPDAAAFIARSTTRTADLHVWLDWMAMPSNGWLTIKPVVPHINQSCTANVLYAFKDSVDEVPYNPCRLTGAQFGAWVETVKAVDPVYEDEPEEFVEFLGNVYLGLEDSSVSFRREIFASKEDDGFSYLDPSRVLVDRAYAGGPAAGLGGAILVVARVAARVGKKLGKNFKRNLTRFAVGKTNSRIPPILYIAAMGYALYNAECGEESDTCKPYGFKEAKSKLRSSLIQFSKGLAFAFNKDAWRMVDDLKDNGAYRCSVTSFSHGHMYEMFMIAYYHALGDYKIVALDKVRKVPLYGNRQDKGQLIIRRPDIELAGVEKEDKSNTWVELKSLNVTSGYKNGGESKVDTPDLPTKDRFLKKIPVFNVPGDGGKGESIYHRQFLLDRIANEGRYRGNPIALNGAFHWQVQQWRHHRKKLKGLISDHYVNNGIPTKTKIPGSRESYYDAVKDRLSSAPSFSRKMSNFPVDGQYRGEAFFNPLFDGLGDSFDDDKLADELLKALKYSDDDVAYVKKAMSDAKEASQLLESLNDIPGIEDFINSDITDVFPDEWLRKTQETIDEKLANYIGCDDD